MIFRSWYQNLLQKSVGGSELDYEENVHLQILPGLPMLANSNKKIAWNLRGRPRYAPPTRTRAQRGRLKPRPP
eukprot:2043651-Rhodomonas_salina.1